VIAVRDHDFLGEGPGRLAVEDRRDQALQELRREEHVRVDEDQDVAVRGARACVARGAGAEVPLADRAHAAGGLSKDGGSIGRPVVDHDHLDRRIRLREKTPQACLDMTALVIRGDDHAHGRPAILHPFQLSPAPIRDRIHRDVAGA
jgi:hypothetical protein